MNAKSPIEFAERVLGVQLTQHQLYMLDAVVRHRRTAIAGCHASGKSFCAAVLAIWWAVRHKDARVLIISPTWMQVRSVLWHEIHSLLRNARMRLPLDTENQVEIRLDSSLVLGLSTNDSGRLQGHHSANTLILVDEATAIPADFWPSIEGILAGGKSRMVLMGNPVALGYFSDCFGRNRAAWHRISISAFDTPNFVGVTLQNLLAMDDAALDKNAMPFLATRRWVKERYQEWWNGSIENSPLWASRVLGEFPSTSSNSLIPIAWLEHARREAVDPGGELVIGVDPAGPGRDLTAVVACCGATIVDYATFTDADARGPVLAWLKRWSSRVRLVRVDSAGLGFYFTEHIRDAGYRTVGVNVAGKPDDDEKYSNLKASRYWRLRERFQSGEVSGLSDDMLAELAAITWLVDTRGRIAIEGKADVKAALGHSPDLAEALMIAIGEGAPQPYEYRTPPPDTRSMGYGHARAASEPNRCAQHPWRESCVCLAEREDDMPRGMGRLRFTQKGTW